MRSGQEGRRPRRERLLRAGDLVLRSAGSPRRARRCTSSPASGARSRLTFAGHEWKVPFEVATRASRTSTTTTLRAYAAVIVPSGMVSDRLRYTEDVAKLPPATEFLERAFAEPRNAARGSSATACGSSRRARARPRPAGRRSQQPARRREATWARSTSTRTSSSTATSSPARTGGHCHLFARKIIELLEQGANGRDGARSTTSASTAPTRIAIERWYTKHFGFERKRVYLPGPDQVRRDRQRRRRASSSSRRRSRRRPRAASATARRIRAWRHLAFLVDDLDAKLAEMGDDAKITLGPLDMGGFHRRNASRLDLRPGREHR